MTVKTVFISIFDGKRIEECYKDVVAMDGESFGDSSVLKITLKYKDGTSQVVSCHSLKTEPDETNKNHGCGTTFDDLIAMADKIDMSRKEEASKYLNNLLEKKDVDDPKEIIRAYKEGRNPPFVQKWVDEHPEEAAHIKEVIAAYKRGETPESVRRQLNMKEE